jgi:uncharacterized protein YbcV (DUF1398 family)
MFTIEQIEELHARLGSAETLADSGVERWTVDTRAMTMTYSRSGEVLLAEQLT